MNKLKVGIIGCGTIFPMHAESIKQACADIAGLAAVCDIKQDRLLAAGSKYKCATYANYKAMIDQEKLDVVHICTPHYLHKEMSSYAAEKGVNIYQEKPMAINAKDAVELYRIIKEKKIKYAVSFQNRFNPSTRLAKKAVDSGKLGKILSAKLILSWHKPDDYYLKSDWKGTWDKEGGGVVIDQAIHSLDLLRYVFNSEIDWVDATTVNRMHVKIQVDDEAAGVIMFKNGSYVNFYTISHYSYDDDVVMEIHCENGKVKIVKDSADVYYNNKKWFGSHESAKPKKSEFIDYGAGWKDYWGYCHSIEIKKFYGSIINNTPVDVNEDEALATQWLIEAIYASGKSGKKVYMDELKKSR
jgi:predicted dehydrogenase